MSNFLAVATVTAALGQTLQGAVGADVPGATVSTLRPDGAGAGTPAAGINLFLYQVSPNGAWRNADLPTRRPDGQLAQRPQVALDLHYLLTFYGDEATLEPQRLLGSAVRTLHAQPVLTRQVVGKAAENLPFPGSSDLAEQVEVVRLTPLDLSLEELSKLWSVFFQTRYALSVAYQASVVLIESDQVATAALPARARNIYVVPFRQPVVDRVTAQGGGPVVAGSMLVVQGRQLRGEVTRLRIGGVEVTPAPQDVGPSEIGLPLSSPPFPAGWPRAGPQGVQIVHETLMGTPPAPHRGVESNVAAFVLRPTIAKKADPEPDQSHEIAVADKLTVKLDLPVGVSQRVVLFLNAFQPQSEPAPAYSLVAETREQDTDLIAFPVGGIEPGQYLVRVGVDGAQSPLETDPAAEDAYVRPRVTVP